jgi:galactitol-specific phosphotransferase system IIB component
MRSLEKNFFSVEQRLYQDINQTKINLELKVQRLQKKIKHIDGTDIFTILSHMDFAISQIHPTQEKTIMLINQVRLDTDELSRLLREEVSSHKTIDKNEAIVP